METGEIIERLRSGSWRVVNTETGEALPEAYHKELAGTMEAVERVLAHGRLDGEMPLESLDY